MKVRPAYNRMMPIVNVQRAKLLRKTADYYRRSIADYSQFVRTERKPRTKKHCNYDSR